MVFASWLKRFRHSLERQARAQCDRLSAPPKERPARGRRFAHRIEVVEERTLLSSVTFTVNSLNDAVDANVGDGIADSDLVTAGLQTTLRAAIMEANASTMDTVEIVLGSGTFDLTIVAAGMDGDDSGDLNITNTISDIQILGAGEGLTTIDATSAGSGITTRVFDIASGAHRVEIEDVTLRGTATGDGGAIFNRSFLDLDDVTITGSSATGKGGGLFNAASGTATLVNTTFSGNTSTDRGAAIFNEGMFVLANGVVSGNTAQADGGGLAASSSAVTSVITSTFSGNMAQNSGRGGAVAADGGSLTLEGTRLSLNTATGGGGVFVSNSATVRIDQSTLDANTASGGVGGAVSIPSGDVTIVNSTLSGNTATTALDAGGAIRIAAGSLDLTNVTITANNASVGNDGGVSVAGGTVTVLNTIIAGNTAAVLNPDVAGTFVSRGSNIVQDATGSTGFGVAGDLFVNPELLSLADNGGASPTHALQLSRPTSLAIDAGNTSLGPATDQRRVPRPQGANTDIGAYETGFGGAIVTTTADSVMVDSVTSLREAIIDLNTGMLTDPTIIVPPGVFTLSRTGTEASDGTFNDLDINFSGATIIGFGEVSTVIDGSGLTGDGIDMSGNDRVLEIGFGGGATITGVGIENGNAGTASGGGILANGDLTLSSSRVEDNQAGDGGGLAGFSGLTLNGVTVSDNMATNIGGGVAAFSSFNRTTIRNSTIARNSAASGGGLLVVGLAVVRNTMVTRNTAVGDGGGIAVDGLSGGSLEVSDSTVNLNTAGGFGAGIGSSGFVEIIGTTISNNTATLSGGGVGATAGKLRIAGSTITGNVANQNGGGVAIGVPPGGMMIPFSGPVDADITFSDISSNSAVLNGGGVANSSSMLFVGTSSLLSNSAANGGGLVNSFGGTTDIVSSTVSGNTATGPGVGGGLLNDGGTLDVTNATITNNTAASGGGVASQNNQLTKVQNSIVAGNLLSTGVIGRDVFANTVVTTGGNNVIGVGEFGFVNGVNNDQTDLGSPLAELLEPLQNNGGLTQTHALPDGSAAIDAGNNTNLDQTDAEVDVDQRGAERILNGGISANVDVGAFESGSTAIFVTTTADVVGDDGVISLREAINTANGNVNANRIVLPAGKYELTLTGAGEDANASGDLDITNPVTIVGYGRGVTVVDGASNDRIFDVLSTTATFLDLTIQNGQASGSDGGGLRAVSSTTTLERGEVSNNLSGGSGGGVSTSLGASTFNAFDTIFRNNIGQNGGGAISSIADAVNVSNSIFERNTAPSRDGGAINIFGANTTITGSQFTENMAPSGRGGAVFVERNSGNTVVVDTTRFSGNVAVSGGAISNINETLTVTNSEFAQLFVGMIPIIGNVATGSNGGGAIQNVGGNLTVTGTLIRGSSANSGSGGGISSSGMGAQLLVEDSEVSSNNALNDGGGIFNSEMATIRRSTSSFNSARNGGGLVNDGTLLVFNSTFSGNSATNGAGAIQNQLDATATFEHSTITGNQGGLGPGGISNEGTVNLKNSIVAVNTTGMGKSDLAGLGMFNSNGNNLIGDQNGITAFRNGMDFDIVGGETALAVTITNASDTAPIQIDTSGAHGLVTGDRVRIENVTGNLTANGTFTVTVVGENSFTLDFSSGGGAAGSGGDIFVLANPLLGFLQDNTTAPDPPTQAMGEGMMMSPGGGGGAAPDEIQPLAPVVPQTHRPLPGSPVIDAGDAIGIEATDNRGTGFPRNVDGDNVGGAQPDIGAVELFLTSVTGLKLNDVNGDGIQQVGPEAGLPDVTVYADINASGTLDQGDRFTTTLFDGTYTLDLVPPGTQIISELVAVSAVMGLPGFRQTAPLDPLFGAPVGFGSVTDPIGVVTGDFDKNGALDVAFLDPVNDEVRVLISQMNGQFSTTTYAVGDLPQSVTVDDFNNDGFLDLIVANFTSNNVSVLRNQGNGTFVTFATVAVGTDPVDIATGDFNLDGFRDFATVNRGSNNVSILTGDGTGMFTPLATPATGASPRGLTVADFDRDGNLDIATANFTGDSVTLLLNQGGGTFLTETLTLAGTQPAAISSADFDLDGLPDLVLGLDQTDQARVMLNRGAPAFFETVNLGAVADPTSVNVADINGDGLPDVVATSLTLTNNVVVFLGNTTGPPFTRTTFTAGGEPQSLAVGDLNSDGRPDLITTNRASDDVTGLVNLSGSRVESLTTGVVASNVNFGNQQLALISGVKFSDLNSNGVRDTMPILEPGLSGVTVWLDLNSNGVRDSFEPMTTTLVDDPSTTGIDETGQYSFADVVPGPVRVVEVVQPGFAQTTQQMNVEFDSFDVAAAGDNGVDSLVVDLDADGRNDVVVLSQESSAGNLRVFAGTGTQHVSLVATLGVGINPVGVAAADLDADGDLDIAVANSGSDNIQLFENTGNLTFVLRQTLTVTAGDMPGDVVLSDVNGDGRADVIVGNANSPSGTRGVSIFTNNNSMPGSYAFNAAVNLNTGGKTVAVEAADLDNDGDPDIAAVVNNTNEVRIFENVGGSFVAALTVPTGIGPQAITISDFNRDGRADLVVGKTSGFFGLQFFAGSGRFQYAPGLSFGFAAVPDSLAVADTNSDGLDDVVFTIPSSGQIAVLLNSETGFTTELRFSAASQITGVSVGNLDGDTLTDIVAVQNTTGADVVALFNRFGSIPLTMVAGQPVTGQDFGNVQLGTISGTKFHDIDLDGIQGEEEDGIQGLKIFLDIDNDGRLSQAFEPFTTTDANGNYQLNNVPVLMTVSVAEEIVASGFFQTFPNQLLLGESTEFDTPLSPQQTAVGDLDGDNDLDTATAIFSADAVAVGLVDSATRIVQRSLVPVDDSPTSVRLADINGDGNLDIITASLIQGTISLALGNGNGTFGTAANIASGSTPRALAIGDFDKANGLDIAVTNGIVSGQVTILLNDGVGGFTSSIVNVGSSPREIVTDDLNGDTNLDLAVANSISGNVSILINNGSGGFTVSQTLPVGTGPVAGTHGLTVGDFDEANAAPDLVVINQNDATFQVLTNNGSGTFSAETPVATGLQISRNVSSADLNGDGNLDIVVADNSITATNALIGLGDGMGGFVTQLVTAGKSQGDVQLADVSGNGRPDIVLTLTTENVVEVLPNRTGAHDITLVAGEMRTGLNFGNRALPGSVSGVKFRDDNENGVQDGSEPGLPGFTVFVDLDNDDVLDAGEPFAITGPDGSYTISGLETLTEVTVSEVQQAGFVQTAPLVPSFAFSGDISPGGSPAGVVTGDFDGINGEDIAVTLESSNQVAVILRQPSGAFGAPTLISVGAAPFSIVTADFDGANGLDLAVANEDDGTVTLLTNNGSGVFTPQTAIVAGAEPFDLAVANVNGVTGLDLVVTNRLANTFTVLLNNGSGILTASPPVSTVAAMPSSVAVADIDQDGDQDVAVITSADNMLRIFLQGPIGTFTAQTPIATGTDPSRLRTGLLNNDLVPDLVVVNQQSSNVTVVLNNSSGTLNLAAPTTFATGVSGETLALADFNGDGFTDIVTGGEESSNLALLLNDGMGAFGGPILFPLDDTLPIEVAPITLNADGDLDLVITDDAFPEVVLVTNTFGSHTIFLGAGQNVTGRDFANRNINLAPVLTVPGAQTVDEDGVLTFNSSVPVNTISISDADEALNPSSELALTLSVTNGTLTLPVTTGLTFQAGTVNGSNLLIVTGSLADLNTRLNGLQFAGTADFNGMAALSVAVDDQANFGSGGPLSDSEVINITVNAVNDVPLRTAGSLTPVVVNEDSANTTAVTLGLSGLTYGPGPANENAQTLSYTVTAIPAFVQIFEADGTTGVTAGGTVSASELQGLKYKTLADANGSGNLTFTVKGDGGTANGGVDTLTENLSITVNAVNDVPLRTAGSLTPVVVNEDSANTTAVTLGLSGLTYTPGPANENAQTLSYTVTAIPAFVQIFKADGTTGVTAGGTVSASELQGLKYKTLADANGSGNLTFTVKDDGGTANGGVDTLTENLSITVNAVNDVPLRTAGSLTPVVVNEDSANTTAVTLGLSGLTYTPGPANENAQTLSYTVTAIPAFVQIFKADGTTGVTAGGTVSASELQGLKYKTLADVNGSGNLTFTVKDNGGTGNGGMDTLTENLSITVTAVNDAPFFAGVVPPPLAFVEGGIPLLLSPQVDVIDAELDFFDNWSGAQLTLVRIGGANPNDVFDLDTSGPISLSGNNVVIGGVTRGTVNVSAGSATITFNANAGSSDVDAVAQAVTYQNTSDNPLPTVPLEASIEDGNSGAQETGGSLTFLVLVTPVNDPPVLAGIEQPDISYLEDDSPVQITNTVTVTDLDDTNIESARARINSNYQVNLDVLAADTSGTSITATFDASQGELNLTGSDTITNYQTVLRTVTFQHTGNNPLENTRTVSFTVNDGDANSNVSSRDIQVSRRPAEVSGVVWLDTVEDGIRNDDEEVGEPRVQGVAVSLVDPNGTVIASTTTNVDGEYSFSVAPGQFRAVLTPPNDRHLTIQDALVGGSPSDANDSDLSRLTGATLPLGLLTSGATASNVDAGLVITTVSIAAPGLLQEGNAGLSIPANFTVSLNGPATRVVTVNVIATSRTATLGIDFEQFPAAQQTVTFQPGEVSKTATLNVSGDAEAEADEDFQATLSNPVQAVLGVSNAIATIFDDDMVTIPRVVIETVPAPTVIEGNPLDQLNLVFIARLLTGSADADIDVSFSTIDPLVDTMTMLAPAGQATPANGGGSGDYTPVSGNVTIEAGQTSAVIQVQVIGDVIDEPDETVSVRLNSVSGANAQLGMSTEATGSIIDDDDPTPSISVLDGLVRELDPSREPGLSFVLEREDNADLAITGTYRTVLLSGAGAAIASDFTGTQTGTFEIAAGATRDAIVVPVIGDLLNEGNETFGIELLSAMQVNANGSPGGSVIIARRDATGTIDDDDDPPVLSLGTGARVVEGRPGRGNVLFVTVTASAAATTDITFTVSTIDQDAAGFALAQGPGVVNPDYIPLSNEQGVISAGLTSTTIPIQIIGDDLVEPDERVRVRLNSVVGLSASRSDTGGEVDAIIGTDDRNAASLRLTGGQIVSERDGMRTSNLGFSAVIDAVLTRNVIVNYRTVPLPSDAGSNLSIPDVDHVAVNTGEGRTVILAGFTSAPISVVVLPDDLVESPLEDVFVEITSFELGPVLVSGLPAPIVTLDGLNARAKSSIRDDDGVVTEISIAETAEVREGDVGTNPARAIVTLSSPASQDLRLTYRTRTGAGTNAAVAGAVTAAGQPVFLPATPVELAPDHEELTTASVLIPRGSLTASVSARVIGDDRFEGNEVFLIELTGVTLANGTSDDTVARLDPAAIQSVVTILDDEFAALPELSFAGGMVNEGDPGGDVDAVFTLSLSGRIQGPVEIRVRTIVSDGVGLAAANADLGDYFLTDRLITLDSEVTSAEFRVGIIEDNLIETDELVIAEILSVTGATVPTDQLIASVLLKDDDDPDAAVFTVDDVSQLEGDDNSNALVHTVSLNVDPANLGGSVTIDVMTLNDTATAGVDYTAVNQLLTFLSGELTKTVTIPILGNTLDESTKDVVLDLSNAVDANGAAVAIAGTGQGIGSILNDDSTDAVLRVDSVNVREGNADGATFADFTVSIVGQLGRDVLVDFATLADTAEINVDFRSVSGTLRFTPGGPIEQTVSVPIVSDTDLEEEFELFVLRLTNARFDSSGSMMNTGTIEIDPDQEQGDGVILDDDRRVFREDGDGQLQIIVDAISDLLDEFSGDRDNPVFLARMGDLNLMALRATGLEFGMVFSTDPVDFLLTDTEGRTTGYTADQGEVTEVARSFYSGDGNVELVILPDATAGLFPLQLSGVGSGEFVQVATLVTESGDSKTISNSGVLTGNTELVLDFTDVGQNNFPTTGSEIFARLANGGGDNSDEVASNVALAVSTAAMEAFAELQRQQSEAVPGPIDPGAVLRDFLGRVEGLGSEVYDAVWNELDSIFSELPETPNSVLNAFWAGFGRAVLGTPDGLLEVLDLLELLKDGDDAPASDEPDGDQPADGNADPADADAPEDAADPDRAQAARRERNKSTWLADLVAVAEESPWDKPRPGDRMAVSNPKPRAVANWSRFLDIARKMQSGKQPPARTDGNHSVGQANRPQPPTDGS